MKHSMIIDLHPTSGSVLFEACSKQTGKILEILTKDPTFKNISVVREKSEVWYPMDGIQPPHCPKDDIMEEKTTAGDWEYTNFLRSHSSDIPSTGGSEIWFMTLKKVKEPVASISGTNAENHGFKGILFEFSDHYSEDAVLERVPALMQVLELNESST